MLRVTIAVFCLIFGLSAADSPYAHVTSGDLRVVVDGKVQSCPLQQTTYRAEIAGGIAQVEVEQVFANPFAEPVEAIYVFPMSHRGAINGMSMEVGDRRIVGALLRRADAEAVFEQAKQAGKTASLLTQQRPNIFTQSVGNLMPGKPVRIRISYCEEVAMDQGVHDFHLPLVVGPRYIPAAGQVADAESITPPMLAEGADNGHRVDIHIRIDGGVPFASIQSLHHPVTMIRPTPTTAEVSLSSADTIADRDFVLRYTMMGKEPQVAVIPHVSYEGGYVQITVHPADVQKLSTARVPRDLCFLVDVSGSMNGKPTEKVMEAMGFFLASSDATDRMQVITFASQTQVCFPDYVSVDASTRKAAEVFITTADNIGGGTEMLKGITAAIEAPADPQRTRMVIMLTDGFIGNESDIIDAVAAHGSERLRFWCLGIGSAPNRYLLDAVAQVGGGMSAVVGLDGAAQPILEQMLQRIQHAQLDRVRIDWGGLHVHDVLPAKLGSLWPGMPLVVTARYEGAGQGTITVQGEVDGTTLSIPVLVDLPARADGNGAIRSLWARRKLTAMEQAKQDEASIVDHSLEYSVMSAHTSFVAVDERIVNPGGVQRQEAVAVPLPQGVQRPKLAALTKEHLERINTAGFAAPIDAELGGGVAFMAISAGGGASGMFGSRTGGGKKRAIGRFGGSKASESAVDAGLRFLGRHQSADGSWACDTYHSNCTEEPKAEPGIGGPDDTCAVTAQCLLTYLGAGYDHKVPSKYKTKVASGLVWLLAQQQADGALATTNEAHALATTAIAEAYAMSNDPALAEPCTRAVAHLLARRIPGADGKPTVWGADGVGQTIDTMLALRALVAAAAGGLDIADGKTGVEAWYDAAWRAANPGWEQAAPGTAGNFPESWSATQGAKGQARAAGAVIAVSLQRGLDQVPAAVAAGGVPALTDLRELSWAAHAVFVLGGEAWKTWSAPVRDALIADQHRGDACLDASFTAKDQTYPGAQRGRLQSTLYAVLALEVYYRYLPKTP